MAHEVRGPQTRAEQVSPATADAAVPSGPGRDAQTYGTVLVHDVGPVRLLILNRPHVRNCLDLELRCELADAVRAADADPHRRAIVLTGAGPVFCAGGDIKTLNADPEAGRHRLRLAGDAARAILSTDTPVVAAVNGGAWGAGLALAAACDLVLVGRSARLVASFGRFGLIGDTGAFYLLRQRVGAARAKEILLLGASLNSEEAVSIGLASRIVEDGQERSAAFEVALQLAGAGEGANAWTKRILRQDAQDFESVLDTEIEGQLTLLRGRSFQEGQQAFVEKREPRWWSDLDSELPHSLLQQPEGEPHE